MLKLVLIGAISGVITGLGMGGGSVLILLLTVFMNVEQHVAQASNLIFFIPTAIIAIIVHFKNGNVDKVIGKKLLLATAIGAGLGAYITSFVDGAKLKKYFGIFLLMVRHNRDNKEDNKFSKEKEIGIK